VEKYKKQIGHAKLAARPKTKVFCTLLGFLLLKKLKFIKYKFEIKVSSITY